MTHGPVTPGCRPEDWPDWFRKLAGAWEEAGKKQEPIYFEMPESVWARARAREDGAFAVIHAISRMARLALQHNIPLEGLVVSEDSRKRILGALADADARTCGPEAPFTVWGIRIFALEEMEKEASAHRDLLRERDTLQAKADLISRLGEDLILTRMEQAFNRAFAEGFLPPEEPKDA